MVIQLSGFYTCRSSLSISTHFERTNRTSKLPITTFTKAITIAVEPGDTEQVLFCRIYNPVTGQSVFAPYSENTDWQQVTSRAIAKIDSAHGRIEQVAHTA